MDLSIGLSLSKKSFSCGRCPYHLHEGKGGLRGVLPSDFKSFSPCCFRHYTDLDFFIPKITLNSPANIFGLLTTTIFIMQPPLKSQQENPQHNQQNRYCKQHCFQGEERNTYHGSDKRCYSENYTGFRTPSSGTAHWFSSFPQAAIRVSAFVYCSLFRPQKIVTDFLQNLKKYLFIR